MCIRLDLSLDQLMIRSFVIGTLFAVSAVFIEPWLVTQELGPDRTYEVIFTAYGCVFVKQIWFQDASWWAFVPAMVLIMVFRVHRRYFWMAMKHGRRWWAV